MALRYDNPLFDGYLPKVIEGRTLSFVSIKMSQRPISRFNRPTVPLSKTAREQRLLAANKSWDELPNPGLVPTTGLPRGNGKTYQEVKISPRVTVEPRFRRKDFRVRPHVNLIETGATAENAIPVAPVVDKVDAAAQTPIRMPQSDQIPRLDILTDDFAFSEDQLVEMVDHGIQGCEEQSECGTQTHVFLEPGQEFVPLTDGPILIGTTYNTSSTQYSDDMMEDLAPSAPPPPLFGEALEEAYAERNRLAYDKRPVPQFWGLSSNFMNCLPNKDFSHLPRFVPHWMDVPERKGIWKKFGKAVKRFWAKIWPFAGTEGKVHHRIELDLYYHLMLEMAFTNHTSKSLVMLKAKARRYLAAFDLSHITSGEYYNMILHTCLAAYFTAGQAAAMRFAQDNHEGIDEYERELYNIIF